MPATETPITELPADLVERVRSLTPSEKVLLAKLSEMEEAVDAAAYHREVWAEIRRRLDAYDRGELKAYDWKDVEARLQQKIEAMKAGGQG